jgi:VWFA-related protein
MPSKSWALLLTLALGVPPASVRAAALPSRSDVPSSNAADAFSESLDVRVVNIDVFVADRQGAPIAGLTREDFRLSVDGVDTAMSNFLAIGGVVPALSEASAEVPGSGLTHEPMSIVLYVDNVALEPTHRARILDDLERFAAAQQAPEVRFLLATHDKGLRIRVPFTESAEAIRQGLDEVAQSPGWGMKSVLARRSAIDSIQSIYRAYQDTPACAPCTCGWQQMLSVKTLYGAELAGRQDQVRKGLAELVALLGSVSGRKALVYVSSGIEQYPGLDLFEYISGLCPDAARNAQSTVWENDETGALSKLAASANANQVTLYTVQAAGLQASSLGSVEAAEARFRPSLQVDTTRRRNLENALFLLADHTGGRAILDSNAPLEPLNRLTGDFEHYYSLAFQLSGPADGRVHELKVELLRAPKGARVRHRRSYLDKPPADRHAEKTLSALYLRASDNPMAMEVSIGEGAAADGGRRQVPISIQVPEWALTRDQPGAAARVHLIVATLNLERAAADLRQMRITVPARQGAAVHPLGVNLRLAPGRYRFAVGFRDEASGLAAYQELEASILEVGSGRAP